jgi:hypothetical protein
VYVMFNHVVSMWMVASSLLLPVVVENCSKKSLGLVVGPWFTMFWCWVCDLAGHVCRSAAQLDTQWCVNLIFHTSFIHIVFLSAASMRIKPHEVQCSTSFLKLWIMRTG